MEEMLFLPEGADSEQMRKALTGIRRTQELSDRLVVVEGSPEQIAGIRNEAGIKAAQELAPAEFDALTGSEKLAVDAWRLRASILEKDRSFDGRSWGKPPD